MSTRHMVHRIIEPGLDGDGIAAPEVAVIRKKLETVKAVSADWYSDLNDAVAAAGEGGIVSLSPGVEYAQDDPLIVVDNITIEGDSRYGSVIKYTGAAAIQSAGPTSVAVQGVRIFNVTLDGDSVGGMGIDARGFFNCNFDMVRVWNPTSHGIWFGGDNNLGGWTNTLRRGDIRAPINGSAIHIEGRTSGGTGAPTGNQIVVESSTLYNRDAGTSYSISVEEGEGNTFLANDMGYGVSSGAAIWVGGALAARNRFIANRTENVKRAVIINGGEHNAFLANSFGLYSNSEFHGAEIYGGSRNVFRDNWWDLKGLAPRVWESGGSGSHQTIIDDMTTTYGHSGVNYGNTTITPQGAMHVTSSADSLAMGTRSRGETHPRFIQTTAGTMSWGAGSGAFDTTLQRTGANRLATGAGDRFIATGGLAVGVHANGIVATPGAAVHTLTHRLKIYDENGNHIGWIPIYDNIY